MIALLLIEWALWAWAEPRTVTLAIGTITANDLEREGCMFAIGQHTSLLLRPDGQPCVLAKELIGSTGTLMFVRD